MSESIGLPKMHLAFENAEKAILTRAKNGVAGVMVRDAKAAKGVYVLTSAEEIPSALGADNQAYVARAFTGSKLGKPAKVVLVVFEAGADDDAAKLKAAFGLFTGKQVDYLAGPQDINEAETAAVRAWVAAYRKTNPTLVAVLPNCAAGDRGIVNYTSSVKVGDKTYAPATYCSRIAGILAGVPTSASCTYAVLDEVTEVTALSVAGKTEEEAQTAAIDAGQLILIHDGIKAKIARGVNSYVKLAAGEDNSLKKIKVTEAEGLVDYYTGLAIDDGYRGDKVNNYDNKCLLMVELTELFDKLAKQGLFLPGTTGAEIDVKAQTKYLQDNGVDTSEMTTQAIKEANTGSWVFWRGYGTFADAMEDFDGRFVRGGSATANEQ